MRTMKNERPIVKDMKTQNAKTITPRSFLVAAAVVGMLLLCLTTPSFGQKEQAERATTRDGLTETGLMTNPEVSDDLDGTEDEYFYKFQARPGKLTLTLEVTANETNAGATLDLFGTNSKAILSNMLVQAADGGSERVSKSVNLAKAQDIIIRIKGLRYGSSAGYPGVYKIRLEGTAVRFTDVAPSDGPVEVKKPDMAPPDAPGQPAPPDGPVEIQNPAATPPDGPAEVKKPDVPESDGTGQDKKPAATPTDGTVQNKKPDAVDRVIEKGKAKSNKLLELLNKVKAKIPD